MKTNANKPNSTSASGERLGEASKLASLLALAAGAVAMPQTSEATVIYTNLTSNPVQINPTHAGSYTLAGLPSYGRFQFAGHSGFTFTVFNGRKYHETINCLRLGTGVVKMEADGGLWALPLNAGVAWNGFPASGTLYNLNAVARASASDHQPNIANYDHKYFAFEFLDPSSNPFYGWVEVKLNNSTLSGHLGGPRLTIYGYAYDTTGAQLAMGAGVPEPSSTALLALGAMALGARGVRSWRRNRKP